MRDIRAWCGGIPRIEGMGVGLRDDADAGPPRVAQRDRLGTVGTQSPAQQAVLADLRSQGGRVVAELSDFRCGLVHERQPIAGVPRRSSAEERVSEPSAVRAAGTRVKARSVNEYLQPGRVPPSNFEAVKRRQRHLDRPEPAHGCRRGRAAPEPDHLPRHPQTVPAQGESVVLQLAQAGIDALDAGALVTGQPSAGIDSTVDVSDECIRRRQGGLDVEHAPGVGHQQTDAGERSQLLIGVAQRRGGGFEPPEGIATVKASAGAAPGRCGEQVGGVMQPRDNHRGLQGNPVVAAADDGHNPAHNSEGTEHPTARWSGASPLGGTGRARGSVAHSGA